MPQRPSSSASTASSSKSQLATTAATAPSNGPSSTLLERRPGSARVRRPPKRLLSPPPPAQPSPSSTASSSHLANSAAKTSTSAAKGKASSPQSLGPNSSSSSSPSPSSSSLHLASESTHGQDLPSGPGKRKRKPSTLRRPPITITAPSSSQAAPASPPAGSARAKASQAEPRAESAGAKSRIKGRHSTGSALRSSDLATSPEHDSRHGYDSDGNCAPLNGESDVDADAADFDGADHLEAPPLIFQARKVSFGYFLEADQRAANKRAKARKVSAPISSHAWPYAGAGFAQPQPAGHANVSGPSPQRSRWGAHHSRTKSLPSLPSLPTWAVSGQQQRSSVDVDERDDFSAAESSDGEEDDFHRAMLDPDFDVFDDDHSSGSAELDTPLQTPNSPRSACDSLSDRNGQDRASSLRPSCDSAGPSTPRSILSLPDAGQDFHDITQRGSSAEKDEAKSQGRDAVFSHALPLSSQHQSHVGHLTLSLPYHEVSVSSTPAGSRKTHAASRFMTPILERRATRGIIEQSDASPGQVSDEQALGGATDKQHFKTGDDDSANGSTSPTLSPTHAVLGLPAVSISAASMTGSPFASAVHRASLSRSGSPATFNLPPSMMESRAASVASPASTHHDLRDVSPFPAADDERERLTRATTADEPNASFGMAAALDSTDAAMLSSAASSPADDASTPLTAYSPVARACDSEDEEPLFGLPETMDLDDIDVAYGGKGKLFAPRSCNQLNQHDSQEQHECASVKDAVDSDSSASGADHTKSTAQRQRKRSFAELDPSADLETPAGGKQEEETPSDDVAETKAQSQVQRAPPSPKTRRLAANSAATPETKMASAGPATFPRSTRRKTQQGDSEEVAASGSPTTRRTRAARRASISSK